MAAESKKLIRNLQHLDSRIIYVVLAGALIIPILFPFSMPLRISESARKTYEMIESLEPGDAVLMSFDYAGSAEIEIHPLPEALLRHIATKPGVRVLGVSFNVEGPIWTEKAFEILKENGKVYGKDYVNLGFRAGREGAIAQMAEDFEATFPLDYYKNPIADLSVMEGIESPKDLRLVFQFNTGFGVEEFIRQIGDRYKVPLIIGLSLGILPANIPYLEAGQIEALLGGVRGAAEYEILMKEPSMGSVVMSAQSLGHLAIIGFLVLGNVAYFLSGKGREEQ
jgi:hypothetical protein